jgi:hypothetical protein
MTLFTPKLKHHILKQYEPHSRENSFAALALRYNITGGKRLVKYWFDQWDGSAASLERKQVNGRPRLLSRVQVNNLIRTPIKNKNRSHKAVHYTQLLPSVRLKSGTQIALRTLQNYGMRDAGGMGKHTQKTTEEE